MTAYNVDDKSERKTPWRSIYMAAGLLALTGAQLSIYYTSTYPYLKEVHPDATIELFGWVSSASAMGCLLSNIICGIWMQRTESTRQPTMFGFALAAIGNILYGLLHLYPSGVTYIAIFSRLLTGFGSGTMGVLRGFASVASLPEHRVSACALASAGFVCGLSVGPVIQIVFMPIGLGVTIGAFRIDMYTCTAFFFGILCLLAVAITYLFFVENYAGMITKEEKKADASLKLPPFDWPPVILCFLLWYKINMFASTIEGMAVPITVTYYGWSSNTAVLFNGGAMFVACFGGAITNLLVAKTRIQFMDRRHLIFYGLGVFGLYLLLNFPWPIYEGPLENTPLINGTEHLSLAGGCSRKYDWCESTTRPPVILYFITYIIGIAVAFPLVVTPTTALFSDLLGPRNQGFMQGIMAFTGSLSQFVTPIAATKIFSFGGPRPVMALHIAITILCLLCMVILYRRMVPLEIGIDIKALKQTQRNSRVARGNSLGVFPAKEFDARRKSFFTDSGCRFGAGNTPKLLRETPPNRCRKGAETVRDK